MIMFDSKNASPTYYKPPIIINQQGILLLLVTKAVLKNIDSSVGQYTCKKSTKLAKQISINNESTVYEQMCADEIKRSMNDLSTFLPNIKDILAPVLQTSFSTQIDGKDLNLWKL